MLCAVIKGPTIEQVRDQLTQAKKGCSLVEMRLDFLKEITPNQIKLLREEFQIPMIFTLRPISQGGAYEKSEEERLRELNSFASLQPEYIDLEYSVKPSIFKELKEKYPETKLIVSYHDFEKMPPLLQILNQIKKIPADLYKIAVMLHSAAEALSVLIFMKEHPPNLLIMGMGPYGEVTRILAPIYGGKYVYASLDEGLSTAPGQVTVEQLHSIYHFENLNPNTRIYGLIGDPISKSIGYLSHNAVFNAFKLPAVYANFHVPLDQLKEFIPLAKQAGLSGLSVTMPLKEEVLSLVDEIETSAKDIGAINTLAISGGMIKGYNTDGKGAIDAIEERMKVQGKKVVIIGAGGAAKAIIKEALGRGALVTILNRDAERALRLAEQLGCKGGALDQIESEFKQGYAILINTTPNSDPINASFIIPQCIVMDINTKPKMTPFLIEAKDRGCTLVYGYEMFVNQAIAQFKIWFHEEKISKSLCEKLKEEAAGLLGN